MVEEKTKMKAVTLSCVVLYAICLVSVFLFVPRIFQAIVHHQHPSYSEAKVISRASTLKSFSDGANALISLFSIPLLGAVSDVYGRKKIMLFGAVAKALYIACLLGAYIFKSFYLVYFACVFHMGMGVHLGAIAFMSDICGDEKEKAKSFGHVMGAFMGGLIIGNVILGIVGRESVEWSLFSLIAVAIFLAVFIAVAFKESPNFFQQQNREKSFNWAKGNPFQALKMIFVVSPYIALLGFVYALNFLSMSDVTSSGYMYTQYRYGWGSLENGVAGAARGLVGVLWQAFGVVLLMRIFPRHYILTAAMFSSAFIHVTQGAAPFAWLYFTAAVIGGFSSIAFPLLQSLVSDATPKEKQGMVLGGLSSVMSLSMLVGALADENMFAMCLVGNGYFSCPGTAFYFSALVMISAGFLCLFLFRKYPPPPPLPASRDLERCSSLCRVSPLYKSEKEMANVVENKAGEAKTGEAQL